MEPGRDPQHEIVQILRDTLADRQARRHRYSLRGFAASLQLAPPQVSEILNGKRKVTRKMASRIFHSLAIDPAVEQDLLNRLPAKQTRRKRAKHQLALAPNDEPPETNSWFSQLSTDEFRVIADWYYFAILSLAETEGFQSKPAWIAKRLGITIHQATNAIDTLLRLGLLVRNADQQWVTTGKHFTTTHEVRDASIRRNHAQALDLAQQALEQVPIELRDFSASVVCVDPDLLPAAKKRLRELRREIADLLESGKKKEVYRLSIQLFPLTRSKPLEKNL